MLPDFPKLKNRLLLLAQFSYSQQIKADELIGMIRAIPYFEGNKFVTGDVEGYVQESTEEVMEIPCEIDRSEIIEQGINVLVESFKKATEIQVQAMHKMLLSKLSAEAARVGNQIDSAGEPFSMDLYFKLLETVQIDFDSHGRPDIAGTRLVMHPTQAERVQSLMTQWQTDESFQRRYRETMLRKREEWRDRESNRKLVD